MAECRYYGMCARRTGSRNLPRSCDARNCWMFRPMPNVDALLALADELEEETGPVCGVCMGQTARRIREACGEVVR